MDGNLNGWISTVWLSIGRIQNTNIKICTFASPLQTLVNTPNVWFNIMDAVTYYRYFITHTHDHMRCSKNSRKVRICRQIWWASRETQLRVVRQRELAVSQTHSISFAKYQSIFFFNSGNDWIAYKKCARLIKSRALKLANKIRPPAMKFINWNVVLMVVKLNLDSNIFEHAEFQLMPIEMDKPLCG